MITWILNGPSGLTVTVVATQVGDDVVFTVERTAGTGDLNGLFIDLGNDGGSLTRTVAYNPAVATVSSFTADGGDAVMPGAPARATNMNGAGDGWDFGFQIGSFAGNDADVGFSVVTIKGRTLAEFDGAEVGVRMQSTDDPMIDGIDREGSVKLTGLQRPDGPPPPDDFPLWARDISNVILVFTPIDETPNGDVKGAPGSGSNGPDGYYTVKIDNWPGPADDDLDNSIDAILAYLIANDPFVASKDNLLGAVIKGGTENTNFYAYGANNTNGTAPDTPPAGLGFSWTGSGNPQPASAVDASYNYDTIFV